MNIKIYNKNFDLTDSFEIYLRDKFSSLDRYQEEISSFEVNLSRDQHHKKGEVFQVELKVALPNKKQLILSEMHADPRAAIDILQDKLSRQLLKIKDKNISRWKRATNSIKSLKFWQ